MLVQASVDEDGTVKITDPNLTGNQIVLGLSEPVDIKDFGKMDWPKLLMAFAEADRLNLPPRTHEDIIEELRGYRER